MAKLFSASVVSGCTIFFASSTNIVLVGNNEDGEDKFPSKMWFVPAGKFGYGRVCFGWYSQAQGGMNDRGLFLDWAALPDSLPPPKKTGKPLPDGCMAERVLATCATVEDALRMFESIDYVGNPAHFLVVDRSGDSIVGEWLEGGLKPIRKKNKQVITNFLLTNPELGGFPCRRFEAATTMLNTMSEVSVTSFSTILKNVSAKWDGGGTKYSNVYDLGRAEVTLYIERDFAHPLTIGLSNELRRGFHEVDLRLLAKNGRRALKAREPQCGSVQDPTAIELIARFNKARGGESKLDAVRSYRMSGTVTEAWGDSGEFEFVAAPGGRAEKVQFHKLGTYRTGFDGTNGWQADPGGTRVTAGAIREHAKRDAVFFNWRNDPEQYTLMESLGATFFDDKDCFALKLLAKSGIEATHYFDIKTGLLLGVLTTTALRSGTTWSRTNFSDYKEFGGVLFPTRLRFNDEGYDITAKVDSVKLNSVTDSDSTPAL
ncbi:MAG TPA: hypothetical protein VJ063_15855 [Verrucomicrobiae bacterium]|nr:hypothetical protein [Verrucomicrobiae bacterium]